jgi:hypothetical protein
MLVFTYSLEILFVGVFATIETDNCPEKAEEATQIVRVAQPCFPGGLHIEGQFDAQKSLSQT